MKKIIFGFVILFFILNNNLTCNLNANKNLFVIAIDPGHQAQQDINQEPIGPGAVITKQKVASGTQGIVTRVPEYKLVLKIALQLRDELKARGYRVVMTRETNNINISNKQRAEIATRAGADIFVRIHADGDEDQSVNGILVLSPSENNLFVSKLYKSSYVLSKSILDAMLKETGAHNRGIRKVDNMSGINWATMPVSLIEIGVMTNPLEDRLMQTKRYQKKIISGIANGIDNYFYILAHEFNK